MSKREAKARKRDWAQAIIDGRVVRFGETTFRLYLTIEQRDVEIANAKRDGLPFNIVKPEIKL